MTRLNGMAEIITKRRLAQWILALLIILSISFYTMSSWDIGVPLLSKPNAIIPLETLVPDDIIQWMIMCTSASVPIVVLQEEILRTLIPATTSSSKLGTSTLSKWDDAVFDQPTVSNDDVLSAVHFGLLEKDARGRLKKLLRKTREAGWQFLHQEKSDRRQYAFEKNEVTLRLSLIEQKADSWYIGESKTPRAASRSARAFMGLRVGSVKWPATRNHFVNGSLYIPRPVDFYLWQVPRSKYIECNHTSAQRMRRMYPELYTNDSVIREDFIDELAYVRDLLLAYRITPIITAGTALGWYRECSFLPYITDADLAFPSSEFNSSIENAIRRDQRIKLDRILGKPSDSYEITVTAGDVKINIFGLYQQETHSWIGNTNVEDMTKTKWVYPALEQICTCSLNERLFYVRCDIMAELDANYGEKWFEPQQLSANSTSNVENAGRWEKSEWNEVYRINNGKEWVISGNVTDNGQ